MTDYRETTNIGKGHDSAKMPTSGQTGAVGSDATLGTVTLSPSSVKPGGTITVEATVSENKLQITSGNDDYCSILNIGPGMKVEFLVEVPELARSNNTEQCIAIWTVGSGSHEFSLDLQIPSDADEGEYDVNVTARMANSGNVIDEVTKNLSVSESGQGGAGCVTNQDCGQGFVCVNGQCIEETEAGGANWTKWILNNPGKAAILGVGGAAALKFGLGE